MTPKCGYNDCGWCYAPSHLETNAVNGACENSKDCPTIKSKNRESKMLITKPNFYNDLTPVDKTLYDVAEIEVSRQWANALSTVIEYLCPLGSLNLWNHDENPPTPERVVESLLRLIENRVRRSADNELEACIEWLSISLNCTNQEYLIPYLREYRRPKPLTLKEQALKDLEIIKTNSNNPPEILSTIEKALHSIP